MQMGEPRAVQRDASFYGSGWLNVNRKVQYWPVWHIAADDGHHTRCGLPALLDTAEAPASIPADRRCRRNGCRGAWPPAASTPKGDG